MYPVCPVTCILITTLPNLIQFQPFAGPCVKHRYIAQCVAVGISATKKFMWSVIASAESCRG
jgi:hypothetical protein